MLRENSTNGFGENGFEAVYRNTLRKHGYQFTQIIGRGGMSRVDEVRHIATGALKAIKHLGGNMPPHKVDRFKKILKRETEYAFNHPNVLKGEDYFEDNGNIFYVMPRMQHNLEYLIGDDYAYPLSFLLDIFVQVVAGLNYLHQNDIIHRDLKPSNILYNRNNGDLWIAICDFGLSQDKMAKFRTDMARMFKGGRRAGTMSYAAPEQMHKDAKYDKRCDIYALGRIMDELVGKKLDPQRKYINTFLQDRQLDAFSKKIYLYKMERPCVLEADIRKHLPASLLNLIMRCLQKNPKRRPADAVQIFYELTKIQQECRMAGNVEVLEGEMAAARARI